MIEKDFPLYKGRIAAGLVGDGSECLGFDDEISQDHDWGPSFCIWLTKTDFEQIGSELQRAYERLPQRINGFPARKESHWGSGRTGVFEINRFYKRFIAFDHPPKNLAEWRVLPENNLATATNGRIFFDPLGEFTVFRDQLKSFYPEDIRLKKIAARCMKIAQSGQYNFSRCVRRNEPVAAQHAATEFIAAAISMIFLLNRQYCPFYKWMHRALRRLPILGQTIYDLILDLVLPHDNNRPTSHDRKVNLIEKISQHIISELKRQSLTDSSSDFLLDHGPLVQKKIRDPEIRAMNVWIE